MNRREFLVRVAGLAAAPILLQIVACGDDGSPAPATDRFTFPGTVDHNHLAEITCAQLNGGMQVTVRSLVDGNHVGTHQITISAAKLANIVAGGTEMVVTTDLGHSHTWTITKPAGVC